LKTKLYLLFILFLFLGYSHAFANTYYWYGYTDSNWNNGSNWHLSSGGGGVPGATDDVIIYALSPNSPTVNVASTCNSITTFTNSTITLASPLTVTGAINLIYSTTFSGSSTLSAGSIGIFNSSSLTLNTSATSAGAVSIASNSTSTITIASGQTLTATGYSIGGAQATTLNLAGAGTSLLTGTTTCYYQTSITVASGSTLTFAAGSTLSMTANAPTSPASFINNSGTINFNGTSGSNVTITGYYGEIYTNTGTINMTYTNMTFGGGGSTINNSGTFTATSSTFTLANPSSLNNTTTSGQFTLTGCTFTLPQGAYITNSATSPGFFKVNGGSTISFGYGDYINNSGLFYAGTSGSAITLNVNSQAAYITNTGTFYLGPTSTINLTGYGALVQNSSGTFTLQSDATGTASIGNITGSGAQLTGTYVVQRWFTGGSAANRGYRLMSSPVNNSSTIPATSAATYNFSSLKTNLLITGTGGSANGFDQPSGYTNNGPTILFYTPAFNYFTSPTAPTNTVKVGSGFYFYFRGDNINNLSSKVTKPYATPEANVVGLQSGTLNQGSFTYTLTNAGLGYNLVGNPYPSSISVTAAALTGTTGFVYTYTSNATSVAASATPVTIASGQGFFVKSNSGTSSIAFTESLKTSGQPATLLLGTPVVNQAGNIKLQMVQDSANYDMAELRFMDSYSPNYIDTEDADDLSGLSQAVFFGAMTADGHEVAIASQPLQPRQTSVFLSVNDNSSGTFKINALSITGIPNKYDVWLKDHFTGDSVNLGKVSTYTFTIDKANAATYGNSRLEVLIGTKVLPPYQLLTFTGVKGNTSNVLTWTTANEFTYTSFQLQRSLDGVTFIDINDSQSTGVGTYSFTDQYSAPLVYYRLQQTDINEVVTYSSIVILKASSNLFTVYPNPTTATLKFTLNQQLKNPVTLNIYNSVGVLMRSAVFSTPSGQQDVSALTPGSYVIDLIDNTTYVKIASSKFIKL
jgi:hypothetical protein